MIFLLSTRNIGNHYFLNKTTAFYMLFFIIYKLFSTPCARTLRENHPHKPSAKPLRENPAREPSAITMRDNHARQPCARTMRKNHAREPCAKPNKVSHTETTLNNLVRLHSITINGNKKNPLSSGYFRPPKMANRNLYLIWPPKKNESTVQKTTSVPPY